MAADAGDQIVVTAIVLANVRRDAINQTAQAMLAFEGVAEVYSVAGDWDLVAIIRVKQNEQLADLITGHLVKLDGIQKTATLIAFRAFSKFDLESMFSLGFENPV